MRPKYVVHLMSLEPLKESGAKCKCGRPKPCDKHDYRNVPNAVPHVEINDTEPCYLCKKCPENKKKACAWHKDFLKRIKVCPSCERQDNSSIIKTCAHHTQENENHKDDL
jgi:hypothetical protein